MNTLLSNATQVKEFLPHLNIIMVSNRVFRFRVISGISIVLVLDPHPGLNSGWKVLFLSCIQRLVDYMLPMHGFCWRLHWIQPAPPSQCNHPWEEREGRKTWAGLKLAPVESITGIYYSIMEGLATKELPHKITTNIQFIWFNSV